jgi:hypothetical protein
MPPQSQLTSERLRHSISITRRWFLLQADSQVRVWHVPISRKDAAILSQLVGNRMNPFPLDEYEFEDLEQARFMARLSDDEPQDNPPLPEPPAEDNHIKEQNETTITK